MMKTLRSCCSSVSSGARRDRLRPLLITTALDRGAMSQQRNRSERPSVFVGSSKEGVAVAKAIQVELDESCEVELWTQGAFGLSEGTLDSLVSSADRFDFAVLVLSADDLVVSRGEVRASPRDNVLFELGLFIGRLGRDRTFIVYDRSAPPKLPTDLAGITTATFQPHESGNIQAAVGAPCTKIEQAITRLGTRAGSRFGRLSKAAAQFQDVSADAQQLLSLLARSRAVELDIISQQFGAFIDPAKLNLIRRDLVDLEGRLSRRQVEDLPEAEQEILRAALPTGAIYVLEAAQLVYPLVRAGDRTFGSPADPQSLATYWMALHSVKPALRWRWGTGVLPGEWQVRYPQLFDATDLKLATKQGRNGTHFGEWVSAIHLFKTQGVLAILEKWRVPGVHGGGFVNGAEKHSVVRDKLGSSPFKEICDRLLGQGPDLFLYDPSGPSRWFAEVKMHHDGLSGTQREDFAMIAEVISEPVRLIRVVIDVDVVWEDVSEIDHAGHGIEIRDMVASGRLVAFVDGWDWLHEPDARPRVKIVRDVQGRAQRREVQSAVAQTLRSPRGQPRWQWGT